MYETLQLLSAGPRRAHARACVCVCVFVLATSGYFMVSDDQFLFSIPALCRCSSRKASAYNLLISVLRTKGSKTKKRMKEEETEDGDCGPPRKVFFLRFCWTWTKWYLITSQTRVKCVLHHRTILLKLAVDQNLFF